MKRAKQCVTGIIESVPSCQVFQSVLFLSRDWSFCITAILPSLAIFSQKNKALVIAFPTILAVLPIAAILCMRKMWSLGLAAKLWVH